MRLITNLRAQTVSATTAVIRGGKLARPANVQVDQKLLQQRNQQVLEAAKSKTRTGGRTSDYIRTNKFVILAVTVILTNVFLSFKPEHLKRPEILARNRLELIKN